MRRTARALALATALSTGVGVAPAALAATPVELRTQARALMEEDQPAEAAKLLEDAVRSTPDDAETWAELGNARLALQQFAPAAIAFEQSVKLAPELATAQYNLAYALRKSGKLPRAAEAYRVYLARYPTDADAHFGLGETLRGLGDNLAAAEAYEKYASTETRPDRGVWVDKARTWARDLRASEVKPVTTDATPHLSFASPRGETLDGANSAAAASPTRRVALSQGLALMKSGRFEEALVELRKAEAEAAQDPWVQAALGSAHLGMGEAEQAAVHYTRALVSAPAAAHAGIRMGLAESARRLGDEGRATAEYRAILADAAAPPATQEIARARLAGK